MKFKLLFRIFMTSISVTLINAQCAVSPAKCTLTSYRSFDGSCNNRDKPDWGMARTTYSRLLPAKYEDGISTPRTKGRDGSPLPNVRELSTLLFKDRPFVDPRWTLVSMQFGQIIAHDMSLALQPSAKCCTPGQQPYPCFVIKIPANDPTNINTTQVRTCMNFVRSRTDRKESCPTYKKGRPVEQITFVTKYIDLSVTYGSSKTEADDLRSYVGGQLKTQTRNGQVYMSHNMNAENVCFVNSPSATCYKAGDIRANQSPQLTILQTVFVRNHNNICSKLQALNPHWNEEKLYQEARKINIAIHQNIVYNEWLPIILGSATTAKHRITYNTTQFVKDYDLKVNPKAFNEHATACFRFFHTNIAGHLQKQNKPRTYVNNQLRLSDWFHKPEIIEKDNNFDDLTRGMTYQHQMASDQFHTEEVTQYLFRNGKRFGSDLKAIDIQRGRDHGLATYNDYREFCGFERAKKFADFSDSISQKNIALLSQKYKHPDDVDLGVGTVLEIPTRGSLVGQTCHCIIIKQFIRTRVGDYHFYENGHDFSLEQLNEIRKSSISDVLCKNTDVSNMQPKGFDGVSRSNPIISCTKIPTINFTYWKDKKQKKKEE